MSWDAARRRSRVLRVIRAVRRRVVTRLAPPVRRVRALPFVSRVRAAAARADATARTALQGSWLYRWLTAEPEPTVVVIDLRETWTVGPLLRVLDYLGRRVAGVWHGSKAERAFARFRIVTVRAPVAIASAVAAVLLVASLAVTLVDGGSSVALASHLFLLAVAVLGLQERRSWAALRETWPVRLAATVFAPPEPPDDDRNR